jgi:hypothetical protein
MWSLSWHPKVKIYKGKLGKMRKRKMMHLVPDRLHQVEEGEGVQKNGIHERKDVMI